MATDRLRGVLAAMAAVDGNAASGVDRVCVAAVELLSLSGSGLSLWSTVELRGTAGVTGPAIERVQELQLELGQGPCVDCFTAGEPVTESDLADPALVRWPAFAQAAADAGVFQRPGCNRRSARHRVRRGARALPAPPQPLPWYGGVRLRVDQLRTLDQRHGPPSRTAGQS